MDNTKKKERERREKALDSLYPKKELALAPRRPLKFSLSGVGLLPALRKAPRLHPFVVTALHPWLRPSSEVFQAACSPCSDVACWFWRFGSGFGLAGWLFTVMDLEIRCGQAESGSWRRLFGCYSPASDLLGEGRSGCWVEFSRRFGNQAAFLPPLSVLLCVFGEASTRRLGPSLLHLFSDKLFKAVVWACCCGNSFGFVPGK